ncbi:MAG TPA: DUF3455 domain-containing protein [Candidatus Binatia bacterium]|nr:DUF3455 domain-containing protein [Candidatus Binatia bacterium]
MSENVCQLSHRIARAHTLFAAILTIVCAFGTINAMAQGVTPPTVPTDIAVPDGNTAFLVGHAKGSQGYVCLPTSTGGTSWTIDAPRPEATLFTDLLGQDVQIITHFLSKDENPNSFAPNPLPLGGNATWQSSFDSSRVWAVATGHIDAGTDPASCPHDGAIPCLRLQSIGNLKGPSGGRLLANVSFVQRLNTNGGAAPTTSCSVGQTQLVGYTADYYFFTKDK